MKIILMILGCLFLLFAALAGVVVAILAFVPFCAALFFLILGLILVCAALDLDQKSKTRNAERGKAEPN